MPALILKLKLLLNRNRYAEKCQKLLTNYFMKQETHMLYLQLFCLVMLFHNLEVSFHFHLTFFQLNVTEMFEVQ